MRKEMLRLYDRKKRKVQEIDDFFATKELVEKGELDKSYLARMRLASD